MQIPASLRSDHIHIASERPIHIAGIRSRMALHVNCWTLAARRTLGWSARIELRDGIAQTYRWYSEHGRHAPE